MTVVEQETLTWKNVWNTNSVTTHQFNHLAIKKKKKDGDLISKGKMASNLIGYKL